MKFLSTLVPAACFAKMVAAVLDCESVLTYTFMAETTELSVTNATYFPANSTTGIPGYCYIHASLGGRINTWFKLPDIDKWNGRYYQAGCGGWCGYNAFDFFVLYPFIDASLSATAALQAGYAMSANDMGNPYDQQSYHFHGNIQAKIDWGYLATHLNAIAGKALLGVYYGYPPAFSYHVGSSTGGRQGLVEAQRYPTDFDGIVAVSPALNETGITTFHMSWAIQAGMVKGSDNIPAMTQEEVTIFTSLVTKACDGLDGLEDGVITDPRACHVDLASMQCAEGADSSMCLSMEAIEVARKFYQGPVNSHGTHLTLEGYLPGSEFSWGEMYLPSAPGTAAFMDKFATQYLSDIAFWPDPITGLSAQNFSMDTPYSELAYIESFEFGGYADLSTFHQLGSKLIMTHGLADASVPAWFARDFFTRVIKAIGQDAVDSFVRYYEVPGMGHGPGGPGADTYTVFEHITAWVENGTAPTTIISSALNKTTGEVAFTRPLYPYPYLAYYKGCGDPAKYTSFKPMSIIEGYWMN